MPASGSEPLLPVSLCKEGDDRLVIEWNNGHRGVVTWQHLRDHCPCAGCREEREKPPDPFRVLKPEELRPLSAVAMPRVGRYGYKIVWSDGHDTGIYTLEGLRALAEAVEPIPQTAP